MQVGDETVDSPQDKAQADIYGFKTDVHTRYSTLGIQHSTLNTQHSAPNTQHPTLCTQGQKNFDIKAPKRQPEFSATTA